MNRCFLPTSFKLSLLLATLAEKCRGTGVCLPAAGRYLQTPVKRSGGTEFLPKLALLALPAAARGRADSIGSEGFSLPTVGCRLLAVSFGLSAVDCQLSTVDCSLAQSWWCIAKILSSEDSYGYT